MEKKGDLLNQMAIISDLIEKVNLNVTNSTIVLELSDDEYIKTFYYINKKQNKPPSSLPKTFTIKIGVVEIIFNKNSAEKVQTS
jgi:hypothetical protein